MNPSRRLFTQHLSAALIATGAACFAQEQPPAKPKAEAVPSPPEPKTSAAEGETPRFGGAAVDKDREEFEKVMKLKLTEVIAYCKEVDKLSVTEGFQGKFNKEAFASIRGLLQEVPYSAPVGLPIHYEPLFYKLKGPDLEDLPASVRDEGAWGLNEVFTRVFAYLHEQRPTKLKFYDDWSQIPIGRRGRLLTARILLDEVLTDSSTLAYITWAFAKQLLNWKIPEMPGGVVSALPPGRRSFTGMTTPQIHVGRWGFVLELIASSIVEFPEGA